MEQQRRFLMFMLLSMGVMIGWQAFILPIMFPPPPRAAAPEDELELAEGPVSALLPENLFAAEEVVKKDVKKHPARTIQLGSMRADSEFFLAVQLTTRGAAVDWIQLNDPRYPEFGNRQAHLTLVGHDPRTPERTFATMMPDLEELLDGASLESLHWELVQHNDREAVFQFETPDASLRLQKRYFLIPMPKPQPGQVENYRDTATEGYQLHLEFTLENLQKQPQTLQYTLRGPVSLPLEDPHNSYKHNDVRMGFLRSGGYVDHSTLLAAKVVEQDHNDRIEIWKRPIQYLGVDTQFFAALVLPGGDQLKQPTIESSQAVLIAERKEARFADVSVLLTSTPHHLPAAGKVTDEFVLFAGPKREALLAPLKADSIMDFGWFAPVVRVMLAIVHALHAIGLSYGLAIIGLTCLVRAAMIPLTLHQARSMDKMKELQPKIKVLHEKYKKDPTSLTADEMRQMQEVNLKMFAGCLPLLAQMPIFIALYRALQVSVDLRMAPFHLFGNWIDNLASPDAMFALGFAVPWLGWTDFNLLPLLSIVLMQLNQKLTMPPPADEEQAMQYRMMNIMMYVMVIFFYRVPAGLCLYFIMSSVWGTTERLIMKRINAAKAAAAAAAPPVPEEAPPPAAAAPTRKPEAPAATSEKPSIFSEFRRQLRELQEMADKEAYARRQNGTASENGTAENGQKKPENGNPASGRDKKKKRGRNK